MNKLLIFSLLVLGLMTACDKKEEKVGMVIQPNENKLKLYTATYDNFELFTSSTPAVKTSRRYTNNLLGSINDSKLGKTSAFFATQYLLGSQNVDFGDNPELISFKVQIDVAKHQGDSAKVLNLKVNELINFDIDKDSLYSSDIDLLTYMGEELADTTYTTDTLNLITFNLSTSLANKILTSDPANLVDDDAFKEAFKGLVFSVDTDFTDLGMMWKLNLASSRSYIELKYRSLDENQTYDTTSFKLKFGSDVGRFNQYFINNSVASSNFGNPAEEVYIASPGVTRAHINLAPVLNFKDSGNLMIYKAELIAKAQKTEESINLPNRMLLEINKGEDTDTTIYINDIPGAKISNYDGYYNEETESYHMVITRHVQNLIGGANNDSLLWIMPTNQRASVNRAVLLNGQDNDKIKLQITYSKLN